MPQSRSARRGPRRRASRTAGARATTSSTPWPGGPPEANERDRHRGVDARAANTVEDSSSENSPNRERKTSISDSIVSTSKATRNESSPSPRKSHFQRQ